MSKDKFFDFIKKYKIAIIIVSIVIIAIIATIIIISINKKSEKDLKLSDFQRICIYNYLENNILDIQTLNLKSNNEGLNNVETIQVQVQSALNEYFTEHPDLQTVSVDEVYSILSNKYKIDTSMVDFHGLVLENYDFHPETNEIVKNSNQEFTPDYQLYNQFDKENLSAQKLKITKLTKLNDNEYKVYANITENENLISTTEVILNIENDELNIKSCSIYDK